MFGAVVIGWSASFVGLRLYRTYQREEKWNRLLASGTGEESAQLEVERDNSRDLALTVATAVTALVHLQVGITSAVPLFVLNGVGYVGLLGLYYLPQAANYRDLTRDALITYSAVTIVGYFNVQGLTGGLTYLVGMVSVVSEVGLIGLLWKDEQSDYALVQQNSMVTIDAASQEEPKVEAEPTPEPAAATAAAAA
jgi:hypothetical protein